MIASTLPDPFALGVIVVCVAAFILFVFMTYEH
jgi:hypothetical protein